MHVTVGHIKWDLCVPAANFAEGGDVYEREAVIGEEAHCPAERCGIFGRRGGEHLAESEEAVGVNSFKPGVRGQRGGEVGCGVLFSVFEFVGDGNYVHVRPEIVRPFLCCRGVEVVVLELCEREECGCN